ncbi:MAG: hypothetical protein IPL46_17995 [Saprospiraceae bacterium]|nr:hypothetical protein [Saprospiraceae bacterium]
MNNNQIQSTLFLFLILLLSCQKVDVPDPVDVAVTEPVFYSEINLGGNPFIASAGKGNYVMDADFNVDADKDILDLIGFLRLSDCTSRPCPNSLRIILRGLYQGGGTFDINQVLAKRDFDFAWTLNRDSALVRFSAPQPAIESQVLTWKFPGEKDIRQQDHFERILQIDQDYQVSLHTKEQSCESSQLQIINLATGGCKSVIRVENGKAFVRSLGKPPFKVLWSDGSQDSVVSISAISVSNSKILRVKVIDSDQCESEATIGLGTGTGSDRFCETNFTYSKSTLEASDLLHFGKVLVEYTDDTGVVYRSNGYRQPNEASFKILEVTDFEKNDRGQKTKKIKCEIKCLLSSRDNPEKEIELKGVCVLAVAYPD